MDGGIKRFQLGMNNHAAKNKDCHYQFPHPAKILTMIVSRLLRGEACKMISQNLSVK
jgi:hypothetical protein